MIVQRSVVLLLLMMFVWVGCGEDKEEVELSVEDLIIQLGDLDSYVALKASEKLIEMGEPAVPELIKVLTLPNMGGRQKLALQALQKIGAPSVQQLIPLLENPLVRSQVTEVLFAIGTSEALQAIQATKEIIWEKDGKEMVLIPPGSFEMGDHLDNMDNALPVHRVELDAPPGSFYMDVYEVTVGQFRKFVGQSGYKYGGSWDKVAELSPGDEYPMVYVSWFDATAYCEWAGKRLATEVEWEYAARGGLIGKRYPWGDEVIHDDANYRGTGGKDKWRNCAPVGSFKPNGYGLYDMAGNAWEWCADWWGEDYYATSPLKNPTGPETGQYRVVRGGSWYGDPLILRAAYRRYYSPAGPDNYFGFRCVSGF